MKHLDIIKDMTLEEKAMFCDGKDFWHTPDLPRKNIPSVTWTDGPHGIRKRAEKKTGEEKGSLKGVPSICFPLACATACSWDPDMMREMGELLGEECIQEKVAVLLGPGTNMKRSPLCGRNFEYFSEDPVLAGEIAAGLIEGIQSKGIGTSIKHFAANNQETRRMTVDTIVDERAMREIYLTAFEIAIKKAKPKTVMCMYNRLNGTYGAENKWLLKDVLRDEWGFDGVVVTDWGAENDRVKGLAVGEDLEMPTSKGIGTKKIIDAVKSGEIDESILDESVDRILDVVLTGADAIAPEYKYDAKAHHAKAREFAGQCMVLLKNDDNILPLKSDKKIAVIGKFAKQPRYQGEGSSVINPIFVDNAYDSFCAKGVEFTYCDGYALGKDKKKANADELLSEAVSAAKKADVAVVFAGLTEEYEAEGFDRKSLLMPPEHLALIDAVAKANENTVVVLAGGSAVEMPWADKVKGILNTLLTGEASGSATVDILFGDVNPSGKLAETIPYELADTPAANYFPGKVCTTEYRESIYIGYRYYDTANVAVRYPFGYGLSYTSFEYSDLTVSAEKAKAGDEIKVSFTVKNTGNVAGAEVCQLYVKDDESTIYRPEKELKAFKKVFLQPGEEKKVELTLSKRAFAFYDVELHDYHVESGDFEILVGASSKDIKLSKTIFVESDVEKACPDYREVAPCYYTADIKNVPDDQFVAVLGRELPPAEVTFYPNLDFSNTLEHSFVGKNGKKIQNLIKKFIPEDSMAYGIATQTPVKNFISMSMGILSPKLAGELLDILNDKKPLGRGIFVLICKAIPSVIPNIGELMKSI